MVKDRCVGAAPLCVYYGVLSSAFERIVRMDFARNFANLE
jgi:hypothetical protein